jgi:PAS domain S-box-containing protein
LALALQIQQWAAGGAFVLLGLLTVVHSIRHGGGARRYLALSVGLLGAVGLVSRLDDLTANRYVWLTDVSVTLFLFSGWAFLLFRNAVLPMRRWLLLTTGAVVVITAALLVAVSLPSGSAVTVTWVQLLVTMLFAVVWLGCVGEPIVRLFRLSFGVPAVQRARLRALTLGYAVIVVILILSVAASYVAANPVLTLVVSSLTVVAAPVLYIGFAPPQWLRRSWREREEASFRKAVNDLLLYSPDRVTLGQRALEWATRLVGAEGGVLATADGAVLVTQNMDQAAAWEVLRDMPEQADEGATIASVVGTLRGAVAVPLDSQLGRGVLAVTAGPLTPVFGEDELERLRHYAVAVTSALDRVQLVERLQRNVELLDLAYDAILTWDIKSGAIGFWNRAAEDVYGWTAAEAVGREPSELLKTSTPLMREEIVNQLRTFGRWEGELVQYTKEGTRIDVSARWALQKDVERRAEIVLEINRDITASKRAAEELRTARDVAEQASRAKSEYLSRMSHELRTPLTAMLGYSDLLEIRAPRDDQTQAIAAIQKAGGHLLSLVNDVLDIARIESGREMLALESVAISDVVDECVRLITPAAMERRIHVATDFSAAAGAHVIADRQRTTQALLNLLSNAIKYSGDSARVDVIVSRDGDARVRVAVSDTGPGIAPQLRERLFQPFERLGAERTTIPGTGLGLALTRKLVEAMRGELGVESVVGEGTTFWILLDRAPSVAAPPVITLDERAVADAAQPQGERVVLYVEDNLATIALMEDIFAMRPQIRLITAMQGGLTLELARQHQPDLIVLDLHLPDLSGDTVLRRLRRDPRTAHIPVVIFSADATERQVRRLMNAGARAYLTKPAKVAEFLRMLDDVFAATPVAAG